MNQWGGLFIYKSIEDNKELRMNNLEPEYLDLSK